MQATGGLSLPPLWGLSLILLGTVALSPAECLGQLAELSRESPAVLWRRAQLTALEEQLTQSGLENDFRDELQAQQRWLQAWQPGELSNQPLWKPSKKPAEKKTEPVIDPNAAARKLRRRLFGEGAKPTAADTTALRNALVAAPADVGLRQLHLQWLDQPQYRKKYPVEIAQAANILLEKLDEIRKKQEQSDEKLNAKGASGKASQSVKPADLQWATAYTLYRRARALAYRELPEVREQIPIESPKELDSELSGCFQSLLSMVGRGRAEFVLLEVRMLRRDGWYGRALCLLEDFGAGIEQRWLLKKRRDLLRELEWDAPAKEAHQILTKSFPEYAEQTE